MSTFVAVVDTGVPIPILHEGDIIPVLRQATAASRCRLGEEEAGKAADVTSTVRRSPPIFAHGGSRRQVAPQQLDEPRRRHE